MKPTCTMHLSIIDQHYALSYITPLFDTQAPTCFGIHMPTSGSFSCPRVRVKVEMCMLFVIYCEYWWPVCTGCCYSSQLDNITHGTTTTSAHRPPTFTVYDKQHKHFYFKVTHEDIRSSLKMEYGCRNM
jgi:hypothetical protein